VDHLLALDTVLIKRIIKYLVPQVLSIDSHTGPVEVLLQPFFGGSLVILERPLRCRSLIASLMDRPGFALELGVEVLYNRLSVVGDSIHALASLRQLDLNSLGSDLVSFTMIIIVPKGAIISSVDDIRVILSYTVREATNRVAARRSLLLLLVDNLVDLDLRVVECGVVPGEGVAVWR